MNVWSKKSVSSTFIHTVGHPVPGTFPSSTNQDTVPSPVPYRWMVSPSGKEAKQPSQSSTKKLTKVEKMDLSAVSSSSSSSSSTPTIVTETSVRYPSPEAYQRTIRQKLVQLYILHHIHHLLGGIALRGIWFAVHIHRRPQSTMSTTITESLINNNTAHVHSHPLISRTYAVCVWGADIHDFTIFERLGLLISTEPEITLQNIQKLFTVDSKEKLTTTTTVPSLTSNPWEQIHNITWGTLGPHPQQRPPTTVYDTYHVNKPGTMTVNNDGNNDNNVPDDISSSSNTTVTIRNRITVYSDPYYGNHVHPLSVPSTNTTGYANESLYATLLPNPSHGNVAKTLSRDYRLPLVQTYSYPGKVHDLTFPALNLFPGSSLLRNLASSVYEAVALMNEVQLNAATSTPSSSKIILPTSLLSMITNASLAYMQEQQKSYGIYSVDKVFGTLSNTNDNDKQIYYRPLANTMDSDQLFTFRTYSNGVHSYLTSTLRSILTDPLAVIAHAAALSNGQGSRTWPYILRVLLSCPSLVPLTLRQCYFDICGFGISRAILEFNSRLRSQALNSVNLDITPNTTLATSRSAVSPDISYVASVTGTAVGISSTANTNNIFTQAAGGTNSNNSTLATTLAMNYVQLPPGDESLPQTADRYGYEYERRRVRVARTSVIDSGIFFLGPRRHTYKDNHTGKWGTNDSYNEVPTTSNIGKSSKKSSSNSSKGGSLSMVPTSLPSSSSSSASSSSTNTTRNETEGTLVSPKAIVERAATLLNAGSPTTPSVDTTVGGSSSNHSSTSTSSPVSSPVLVQRVSGSTVARVAALSNSTTSTVEYHQIDSNININANINILYSGADGKEEIGEGLGPTIEFYSLVCQHILRKDLDLWIATDTNVSSTNTTNGQHPLPTGQSNIEFISAPYGLHPLPLIIPPTNKAESIENNLQTFTVQHTSKSALVTHHFEFLGRFVSKALQERRQIDLPLSKPFLKAVLLGPSITTDTCTQCTGNDHHPPPNVCSSVMSPLASHWKNIHFTIRDIYDIDPSLGQALEKMEIDVMKRDQLIQKMQELLKVMKDLSIIINHSSSIDKVQMNERIEEYNKQEELLYTTMQEYMDLWQMYEMSMLDYRLVLNHPDIFPLTWLPPHPDYLADQQKKKSRTDESMVTFTKTLYEKWNITPPTVSSTTNDNYYNRTVELQGIFTMLLNKNIFTNTNNTEVNEWLIPASPVPYYDALVNKSRNRTSVSVPMVKSFDPSEISLTLANLHIFIASVIQTLCVDGISLQRDAFLRGMGVYCPGSCVISPCLNGTANKSSSSSDRTMVGLHYSSILRLYTVNELYDTFTSTSTINDNTLWSTSAIEAAVNIGTHYNKGSPQVRWLIQALTTLTVPQRKLFLKFLTGTPTLPKGGFMSLVPRMTIQKSIMSSNQYADDVLPTASTCHIYLKLPSYSSYDILFQKLVQAITEGHEFFDKT